MRSLFLRFGKGLQASLSQQDDQLEFLNSTRIKDLILKHSAFVGFPIEVYMEHREATHAGLSGTSWDWEGLVSQEESVADSEEKAVTITHKWELINKNKPVWLRDPEACARSLKCLSVASN
eukprot:4505107-Amphidinium_carterae.1